MYVCVCDVDLANGIFVDERRQRVIFAHELFAYWNQFLLNDSTWARCKFADSPHPLHTASCIHGHCKLKMSTLGPWIYIFIRYKFELIIIWIRKFVCSSAEIFGFFTYFSLSLFLIIENLSYPWWYGCKGKHRPSCSNDKQRIRCCRCQPLMVSTLHFSLCVACVVCN